MKALLQKENYHLIFETVKKRRFGVWVSCFIYGSGIVYRIFVISELKENISLALYNAIYFQENATNPVKVLLADNFPHDELVPTYLSYDPQLVIF